MHWYVVPEETPDLPFDSIINSLDWRNQPWTATGPGEVYGAPREFDGWGRIPPPAPPLTHICGTEEDFRLGGLRDTSEPPLDRDVTGIPTCCQTFGGIVLSGTGAVWSSGGVLLWGPTLIDQGMSPFFDNCDFPKGFLDPTGSYRLTGNMPLFADYDVWWAVPPIHGQWRLVARLSVAPSVPVDALTFQAQENCGGAPEWQLNFGPGPVWDVVFTVPTHTPPPPEEQKWRLRIANSFPTVPVVVLAWTLIPVAPL